MPGLLIRLNSLAIDDVVYDLRHGIDPLEIVRVSGICAIDLIAIAASLGLDEPSSYGPALIQIKTQHRSLLELLNMQSLGRLFPNAARTNLLALAAGLYQVLDDWEASHEAAQNADDLGERAVSAYWHGIAHRREPDPGNAAYWFRRVGRHAIFPELAEETRKLGAAQLLKGAAWDPFKFIDFCTSAKPGSPDEALARRIQRAEMDLLMGATVDALEG
jgi:hypothetical protein